MRAFLPTRRLLVLWTLVFAVVAHRSSAQQFNQATDPRPILQRLISAFQNCGPPQVYQFLGQQLYRTIWMQTNGSGCYPAMRTAGPVTGMVVTGSQPMPAGPVFAVRVSHPNVQVDWFIGLSNVTNRVEYLNFQASNAQALPDVKLGPIADNTPTPGGIPSAPVTVPPKKDQPDERTASTTKPPLKECGLYPAMCQ